jgi:hypothetical protein
MDLGMRMAAMSAGSRDSIRSYLKLMNYITSTRPLRMSHSERSDSVRDTKIDSVQRSSNGRELRFPRLALPPRKTETNDEERLDHLVNTGNFRKHESK